MHLLELTVFIVRNNLKVLVNSKQTFKAYWSQLAKIEVGYFKNWPRLLTDIMGVVTIRGCIWCKSRSYMLNYTEVIHRYYYMSLALDDPQ